MRQWSKKWIAVLLSLLMIVSLLPAGALAAADEAVAPDAAIAGEEAPVEEADAALALEIEREAEALYQLASASDEGAALSPLADSAAPVLTPPAGWFGLQVAHAWIVGDNISARFPGDPTPNAVHVHYTTDGSTPTAASLEAGVYAMDMSMWGSTGWWITVTFPQFTGLTDLKVIVALGGQTSDVGELFLNMPALTADKASGLHASAELSAGISFTGDATSTVGMEIWYNIGTGAFDPRTGITDDASVSEVTTTTNAIQYTGMPISVSGATETTAFVVKARAVYLGGATPLWGDPVTYSYRSASALPQLTPDNIDEVIGALSLEERIMLTSGVGGDPTQLLNGKNEPAEVNNDGTPDRGGPAGGTYAIPRFNIPSLVLADGPAGVRMWKNATVWMAPSGMGSTWNPEIPTMIAEKTAQEAIYYAVDIVLGPGINNQRNPLAGRNFEYYSEDPYIAGVTVANYVKAIQAGGVGTSLKHYVANDAESNRSQGSSNVSERALREIYLLPFEMASKEQPWTYMTGYNAVNGVNMHANKWLVTDVLRGEWGHEGFVMSDWGGDYSGPLSLEAQMDMGQSTRDQDQVRVWILESGITTAERVRRAELLNRSVRNILGVLVKTSAFRGEYGKLQADGSYADYTKADGTVVKGLTQADIGLRSGEFGGSAVQLAAAEVNKQAADEGIVLMKNKDGALPLAGGEKVALITSRNAWHEQFDPRWYGDSASVGDVVIQGTGSAQVRFNNNTTPYSLSLVEALEDRGFNVVDWKIDAGVYGGNEAAFRAALTDNPQTGRDGNKYVYGTAQADGLADENAAWAAASAVSASAGESNAQTAARAAADAADVGVFVLTRVSGEGSDLAQSAFNLTAMEKTVFSAYASAFHNAGKKLIALINVGGTVNTTEFRESADAVLDIWNPGTEGTRAIADILKGAVNPSGKLGQTFPVSFDDSPSIAANKHPGSTFNSSPAWYDEGVFVGYRYFETNPEKYSSMVAYPFGYGLSYTTFEYSDLKLSSKVFDKNDPDGTLTASVKVTNTGTLPGKEAVQLYLSASTWQEEGRPKNELKAYGKTGLLQPGESETVTLSLGLRSLQYFDDANPDNDLNIMLTEDGYGGYGHGDGWTVEDDTVFTVMIRGNSASADKPNVPFAGLTDTFTYVVDDGSFNPVTPPSTDSPGSPPSQGSSSGSPTPNAPGSSTDSGAAGGSGDGATGSSAAPADAVSKGLVTIEMEEGAEPSVG
ncbi:MAG: glycoside hydrolase family 3 C-terminal domain-containing protein, partial [Clostridiales bacterium]|nr:glycoside hydrolase family 3 C-terminal domain-containing protein [Clostridiales bacterium]